MPGAHQAALSPPLLSGWGEGEDGKKPLGVKEKGSLIKQKQRPDSEAKENKIFILYFPSTGDVKPLPDEQSFSMYLSRKQMS